MDRVAIVGVGLIGGSFALAIRKHGFSGSIVGVSSEATLRRALELGIVDEGAPLADALPGADLVLLAHPISRILEQLRDLDANLKPGALVTDVGSTKRAIMAEAERHIRRGVFLGGHPMAGKESRGPEHADAALFRGRTWFLTPSSGASLDAAPVSGFVELLRGIGAVPVAVRPNEHDSLVSLTSHLPQLIATTLAALLAESLPEAAARRAAGPGLQDMTRLAMSEYEIWSDILDTNPEAIDVALGAFFDRLTALRQQLREPAGRRGEIAREFEIAANFAKLLRKPNI